MIDGKSIALALEEVIPFFKADLKSIGELTSESSAADMAAVLGEDFCVYIEWKEFNPDDINELAPIARNGISLDSDDLFNNENMDSSFFLSGGFVLLDQLFLPKLHAQLAPHNLQLAEICELTEGGVFSGENPWLVCIHASEDSLDALNAALQHVGLFFVSRSVDD